MLVRHGNELAERVMFGKVVEDEVSADIASNYKTKAG